MKSPSQAFQELHKPLELLGAAFGKDMVVGAAQNERRV